MGDDTTQTRTLAPGPDGPHPDHEKRTVLGLSLSQIAGSALAAVTAAVAASFLGVAGTLIGAAFGSVVSTVAGAAYASSLKTAATRVRTTRTVVVVPGPDGVRGASQTDPARVPSGFGAQPVTLGATTYRSVGARRGLLERVPWKPVAAVAAIGFVLGVGLLTLGEGLLGHPVSDSAAGGTTLSDVVGGSSASTPAPSSTPSGGASPTDPATGTLPAATPSDASPSVGATSGATTTPTQGATTTPVDPVPPAAPAAPGADAASDTAGATQTP
jgi:hypothetical protein